MAIVVASCLLISYREYRLAKQAVLIKINLEKISTATGRIEPISSNAITILKMR